MEFRAAFLLAVIGCIHLVCLADGRQIKSVNKNEYSKQSSQTDGYAMPKEEHQPAAVPVVGHRSVSGRQEVLPPSVPTKSSGFGVSVEGYDDAFRPTTPGKSPGVGHSFEGDDEDIEHKQAGRSSSNNDKHSVAGAEDDFRPTTPGHSPGVGNAFPSKKSEPNA